MRKTTTVCAIAVTAGMLALSACGADDGEGTASSGGGQAITFATYGSAFEAAQKKAMIDPFAAKTGIKVTTDSPVDLAKLKVMTEGGNPDWDVYLADQQEAVGYCGQYFEKLDFTNIKKEDFVPGTVNDCGVPVDTYSYVVAYNTEKYGAKPPTSIKDFFDTTNFPGTRAVSNYPAEGTLELALLADGVSKDKLYPLDYDRAFKVMDRVKKGLVFWETGAEQVSAMESKRADMMLVWSGRGYEAVQNGAPYKPMWADNSYHYATLTIVKGSANKEAAQKFIDFAVSPEPQTAFAKEIAYGAANLKAEPDADPSRAEWSSSAKEHLDQSWSIDNAWWAANQAEATKRWLAWTSG
ncbi:ABC transporter substrate-binding protein [Streptosporangium sp. NPDC051022]|uniref:ABC transporter substrate-binding protein n=1 Tax=Streptosporangium sp. NPDC051022 TaxID=3155752 RepID=UPI003430BD3D